MSLLHRDALPKAVVKHCARSRWVVARLTFPRQNEYGQQHPYHFHAASLCAHNSTVLKPIGRDQVKSPRDIASFLQVSMGHECQEQLCVACLNNTNRIQKIHTVYKGNVNSSMVRAAEVYREPVRLNSVAILIAHQHPAGDCTPSPEDVLVTKELRQAGTIFDIELLDSLIVLPSNYVSLRERGLGFDKP